MHTFANQKYQVFRQLWTEFDHTSVYFSISFGLWVMLHFLLNGVLDSSARSNKIMLAIQAFLYLTVLSEFYILYNKSLTITAMLLINFF